MGQNAKLEQNGDPAAGKSPATGSGRPGLVRHPSLPGGGRRSTGNVGLHAPLTNMYTSKLMYSANCVPGLEHIWKDFKIWIGA